ncbi:uncharacterized protein [Brachyistius frenatus]|uniref:uncharacterized protein n=1 Tax=Brachyistius frenatus TaxID=100188 RepID=UPI0037E95AD1
MSDFEDADFFLKSYWTSPEKRKSKKGSKRDKKEPKRNDSVQKKRKKKNAKFKEAMEKEKKKKKKRKNGLEVDDGFMFTQSSGARPKPAEKPDTANLEEKLKPDRPTPDSGKKTKRTKKVAFDLPPGCVRVKRPKFVSSSPKEKEAAVVVAATARSRPPDDDDSQRNSDDVNSQDLFITQKTFRASPSEDASSGEAGEVKRLPGDSPFRDPKTEREGLKKPDRKSSQKKESNVAGQKKVPFKPDVANLFLDEPIVVNSSPDVAKKNPSSRRSSSSLSRDGESLPFPASTASASTQTENFFTAELSVYLRRRHEIRATARHHHDDDDEPLDLSLPRRARKDLGRRSSAKTSAVEGEKEAKKKKKRDGGRDKAPSGRGDTSPSQRSESDNKSADTTASSEDSEPPSRAGKLDLSQVRAVQTRLNECFFFKTKGEGQSPRPESPLMKLFQGRDVKSRKGH